MSSTLAAVDRWVEHKVLFGGQDEVGIVLYQSDAQSDNDGVTVHNDLERASLTMLKNISAIADAPPDLRQTLATKSGDRGERLHPLSSALIVAVDMLQKRTQKKKIEREIVILTDCGESGTVDEECNDELLGAIATASELACRTRLLAVDLDVKPDPEVQQAQNKAGSGAVSTSSPSLQDRHLLCKSISRLVVEKMKGTIIMAVDMNQVVGGLSRRKSTSVPKYKHTMELTPFLHLNVLVYALISKAGIPSSKKSSKLAPKGEKDNPKRQIVYKSRTDNVDEEIKPSEMVKGYAYGKQLVPFSRPDEEALKYRSRKCLRLIGFVSRDGVNSAQFLNAPDIVLPREGDARSATAISALVNAMVGTKTFAMARFVKRDNDGPALVLLSPHSERDQRGHLLECLIMNTLPFADDLRPFRFQSLDSLELSQAQLAAADGLIDALDLTRSSSGPGRGGEPLMPEQTYNPTLQFFYKCLSKRAKDEHCRVVKTDALDADSTLPTGPPTFEVPEGVHSLQARDAVSAFGALFPTTERVIGKNKRRHWGANTADAEKGADCGSSAGQLETSQASGMGEKRQRVESLDLVEIERVFERDLETAMGGDMDLANRAMQTLRSAIDAAAFRDQKSGPLTSYAIDHVPRLIGKLRKGSIDCYEVAWFNGWMRKFKDRCSSGACNGLWQAVVSVGKGLITGAESNGDMTGVRAEEAALYLSEPLSKTHRETLESSPAAPLPNPQAEVVDLDDDLD